MEPSSQTLLKWPQQLGANCQSCPLLVCDSVPAEPRTQPGPDNIFVVGEGPGKVEAARGRPFTGETGVLFNDLLKWLGIERPTLHVTNSMLCTPLPHTSSTMFNEAVAACSPRLVNELSHVPPNSLIMMMGAKAIHSLTAKSNVKDWGGYPLAPRPEFDFLRERGCVFYPIYHPAYIFRAPAYLPVMKEWFKRGIEIHRGLIHPWKWGDIEIDDGPRMKELLNRIEASEWIGVDVETAGDAYTGDLLCVGLATTECAVSVPWPAADGDTYKQVARILANPKIKKVFQNGNFDMVSLHINRIPCSRVDFDTLIAHRIVAPQVAHDLGFLAACFFAAPRWKSEHKVGDDRKGDERWKIARTDTVRYHALRDYNAKDALMTAKLRPALEVALGF